MGIKIALTICEDLWNIEDDPMYITSPMDMLIKEKPVDDQHSRITIRSPHAETRKAILKRKALKYDLPLIYVNHVGAQTEIIFDGGSVGMNANGTSFRIKLFPRRFSIFDFDANRGLLTSAELSHVIKHDHKKIAIINDALIIGIKDYFGKQNFKKAILGLSGGIDSALVTYLASKALGPENVHTILMPSEFSSKGSIDDSLIY